MGDFNSMPLVYQIRLIIYIVVLFSLANRSANSMERPKIPSGDDLKRERDVDTGPTPFMMYLGSRTAFGVWHA
jgi:hypothetical protein